MNDKPYHILVVDDDPDISMMLKLMLEYKGYAVQTAERAEETVAILRSTAIDLVIMDMLLSGANGTDICAMLKRDEATRQVPIMMISAHPNAREICLQAGADEFISKPFDMQDILSKISDLIKNRPR
ncbi:MAG: response regulator [Chitinophagaceae bacterium]